MKFILANSSVSIFMLISAVLTKCGDWLDELSTHSRISYVISRIPSLVPPSVHLGVKRPLARLKVQDALFHKARGRNFLVLFVKKLTKRGFQKKIERRLVDCGVTPYYPWLGTGDRRSVSLADFRTYSITDTER